MSFCGSADFLQRGPTGISSLQNSLQRPSDLASAITGFL